MDIDIDIKPVSNLTDRLYGTRASTIENKELKPHLVGWYFQTIPVDHITGLAAIPYNKAEELDFKKIDILNLNLLKLFDSRAELKAVLDIKPNWKMLEHESVVTRLFHIKNHFDIVIRCKPKSVEDIADILALIRPGKKELLDKYLKDKSAVRPLLYDKHLDSDLRKSHAVAYAMNIVVQMNLIQLGIDI
jgi:hypothetical protein